MRVIVLGLLTVFSPLVQLMATDAPTAATAINSFGVDLHRLLARRHQNLCISPYSLETALAMAYAGAEGETQKQMAAVLHLPADETAWDAASASLNQALRGLETPGRKPGIIFRSANWLFGQRGFHFQKPFLDLVGEKFRAPFQEADFSANSSAAEKQINESIAKATRGRLNNLIPAGTFDLHTRLVLVNAVYLKAPWAKAFEKTKTNPRPFRTERAGVANVPTMHGSAEMGYAKRDGYTAVAIPYQGGDLHFLILVPDAPDGLPKLEQGLKPETLAELSQSEATEVELFLPKFRLDLPTISLNGELETLGMSHAFDHPERSANFEKIAPRLGNRYLYLSAVLQKTFIAVDEGGTEAAAATVAASGAFGGPMEMPSRVLLRVDRPFLFAIQHRPSGACLFIGRLGDPR